jgi:hypothetical protein
MIKLSYNARVYFVTRSGLQIIRRMQWQIY